MSCNLSTFEAPTSALLSPRCADLVSYHQPINEQEHDRADDGYQDRRDIQPRNISEPQTRADEAADQRTNNADKGGDDESTGIAPGHQKLGDDPCDEAEHNPHDPAHSHLPLIVRQGCSACIDFR